MKNSFLFFFFIIFSFGNVLSQEQFEGGPQVVRIRNTQESLHLWSESPPEHVLGVKIDGYGVESEALQQFMHDFFAKEGPFPNCQTLVLQSCLEDETVPRLAKLMERCPKLKRLDLSGNLFLADSMAFWGLHVPPSVTCLSLCDIGFGFSREAFDLKKRPFVLGGVRATALEERASAAHIESFKQTVARLPLSFLDVSCNSIRSEFFASLPDSLERLDVSHSSMCDRGGKALVERLQQLKNLQKLRMVGNTIGIETERALWKATCHLRQANIVETPKDREQNMLTHFHR